MIFLAKCILLFCFARFKKKKEKVVVFMEFWLLLERKEYFTMISRKLNWLKYLAYENKQILSLWIWNCKLSNAQTVQFLNDSLRLNLRLFSPDDIFRQSRYMLFVCWDLRVKEENIIFHGILIATGGRRIFFYFSSTNVSRETLQTNFY